MRCYYINLDDSVERRIGIEASFTKHKQDNWSLTRVPATDASAVARQDIKGSTTPAEKACFLSHKKIIEESLGDEDSIFILEDDVVFAKNTFDIIDRTPDIYRHVEWDILFTDIIVSHIGDMAGLVKLRRKLVDEKKDSRLFDLRLLHSFGGANAYVVNGKSKRKIHKILESLTSIDTPYDLVLRKHIQDSTINGYVLFPFVTCTSELAQVSNIQSAKSATADLIWDLYRKMMWIDRDIAKHRAVLRRLCRGLDEEERAFSVLWATQISRDFKLK